MMSSAADGVSIWMAHQVIPVRAHVGECGVDGLEIGIARQEWRQHRLAHDLAEEEGDVRGLAGGEPQFDLMHCAGVQPDTARNRFERAAAADDCRPFHRCRPAEECATVTTRANDARPGRHHGRERHAVRELAGLRIACRHRAAVAHERRLHEAPARFRRRPQDPVHVVEDRQAPPALRAIGDLQPHDAHRIVPRHEDLDPGLDVVRRRAEVRASDSMTHLERGARCRRRARHRRPEHTLLVVVAQVDGVRVRIEHRVVEPCRQAVLAAVAVPRRTGAGFAHDAAEVRVGDDVRPRLRWQVLETARAAAKPHHVLAPRGREAPDAVGEREVSEIDRRRVGPRGRIRGRGCQVARRRHDHGLEPLCRGHPGVATGRALDGQCQVLPPLRDRRTRIRERRHGRVHIQHGARQRLTRCGLGRLHADACKACRRRAPRGVEHGIDVALVRHASSARLEFAPLRSQSQHEGRGRARSRLQFDRTPQTENRIENIADRRREPRRIAQCLGCSDAAAATQEPRAIGLELRFAGADEGVIQPRRSLVCRAWPAPRQERRRVAVVIRLYEEFGEAGMCGVRRRRRQHGLEVGRDFEAPERIAAVVQRQAPHLARGVDGDGDFQRAVEFQEWRGVEDGDTRAPFGRSGRRAARTQDGEPAAREIAHVDTQAGRIEPWVDRPRGHGEGAGKRHAGGIAVQEHGVRAVRNDAGAAHDVEARASHRAAGCADGDRVHDFASEPQACARWRPRVPLEMTSL